MSAKSEYLAWRRTPPVGCVFARWMSTTPGRFGQCIEEISATGSPTRVAAIVAKRVDIFLADQTVSAAALLLPAAKTLEKLTKIVLALRAHANWSVTTTTLENSRAGDLVAVHVVRQIPFGDATCPSEVLTLGPFREFPPTRQSPTPALEIFVGPPMSHDPKTHQPTVKANLAHMDLSNTDLQPSAIDRMWDASRIGRLKSLGDLEDTRAKAKVSFVIPASLARQLDCAP